MLRVVLGRVLLENGIKNERLLAFRPRLCAGMLMEKRIESKISLGEITRTRNEVTILPTSKLYFSESIGLKKIFDFTRRKIVELWYFLNTNINTILHLLSNRRRITHTKKWEKIINCEKYEIHLKVFASCGRIVSWDRQCEALCFLEEFGGMLFLKQQQQFFLHNQEILERILVEAE